MHDVQIQHDPHSLPTRFTPCIMSICSCWILIVHSSSSHLWPCLKWCTWSRCGFLEFWRVFMRTSFAVCSPLISPFPHGLSRTSILQPIWHVTELLAQARITRQRVAFGTGRLSISNVLQWSNHETLRSNVFLNAFNKTIMSLNAPAIPHWLKIQTNWSECVHGSMGSAQCPHWFTLACIQIKGWFLISHSSLTNPPPNMSGWWWS